MGVLTFLFMSAPAAGQYWLLGTEDRFQKLNHPYMNILPAAEGLPAATEFCFSLTSWATKNTCIFLTGLFLLLLFCWEARGSIFPKRRVNGLISVFGSVTWAFGSCMSLH